MAAFASGLGAGTALAYLMDPERGRRRRARARDEMAHLYHVAPHVAGKVTRDLGNRAHGVFAEARAMLVHQPVLDDILVERVRARMGRCVSHPGAIEVTATDGVVMLRGTIRRDEVKRLLSGIANVRGVVDVQTDLEIHDQPDHIPALQGGIARPGQRLEWLQENWSPATRMTAVLGGGGLGMAAIRMRGPQGLMLALAGGALATRGLVNLPFRQMLGIGDSPRMVAVHKTIHVKGPIEDVFKLWTNFEDYPRFMEHVEEVRALGGGRYRWRVSGPARSCVEWDAEITKLIQNELIAWQTSGDAAVKQVGRTRFTKEPDGTTRIDVHLTYSPPAGILGHMTATAFGVDPKHSMDDDLVRFQSLFEHGKTTAHGKAVTRDELSQKVEDQAKQYPA